MADRPPGAFSLQEADAISARWRSEGLTSEPIGSAIDPKSVPVEFQRADGSAEIPAEQLTEIAAADSDPDGPKAEAARQQIAYLQRLRHDPEAVVLVVEDRKTGRRASLNRRQMIAHAKAHGRSRPQRMPGQLSRTRRPERAMARTREGHGRPRQANAPPAGDGDDDPDADGLTVVQRSAAVALLAHMGWSPRPLTIRRYQAAYLRPRAGGVR